jgi:hypothetical protein
MGIYLKIKNIIIILLCIFTGSNVFSGLYNFSKAGDVDMIKNDHAKSFSTEYTELISYPNKHEDTISWFDGMVTGNGENGAVLAGSPYTDSIIYNNINLLMPSNDPRYTPDELTGQLDDARQAVINGDASWDVDGRNSTYFYAYHPSHVLRMSSTKLLYNNYIRWTDYETAEVGVMYSDIRGNWERTTFSSREDNVTITRISESDKGAKINMTLSLEDCWSLRGFGNGGEKDMQYKKLVDDDATYIAQIAHYPEYENSELKYGGYCGFTKVIVVDGKKERVVLKSTNDSENVAEEQNAAIKISGAREVYLITKTDRTYDMGKFEDFKDTENYELLNELNRYTSLIAEKYTVDGKFSYEKALEPHAKIQSEMFNTVELDLGSDGYENIPNEYLINLQQKSDRLLPSLVERAYNQGRYAQICCAGTSFPRLCGMWTGEWNSGWRGIYTMDANVNLQSSGMNTGNIYAAGESYIKFVLKQIPDWEENAAKTYGMTDAIQVPVNTDGDRAMMVEYSRWYPFQYWNAGASWMILPIYEFWQCYGNRTIEYNGETLDLQKDVLMPLLAKQANFWKQLCTAEYYTDVNGKACYTKGKTKLQEGEKYLIIPSYSPENYPLGDYDSTITANSTMDIAAARDGLRMTIVMENIVKNEGYEERIAEWENLLELLPEYKFDESGALCEWAMNEYQENNKHRHISHLYPAWPAFETQNNQALIDACNQAIENRNTENQGEDDTASHGWVHKALVGARLKNADSCYNSLMALMADNIYYTSLMADHYTHGGWGVFCTDTTIGTIGIIDEMLLYSNDGIIEALPALPDEWNQGRIDGLRARTNAVVNLEWNEDTVKFTITSYKAQTIKVSVYNGEEQNITFNEGECKTILLAR